MEVTCAIWAMKRVFEYLKDTDSSSYYAEEYLKPRFQSFRINIYTLEECDRYLEAGITTHPRVDSVTFILTKEQSEKYALFTDFGIYAIQINHLHKQQRPDDHTLYLYLVRRDERGWE